MTVGSWEKIRRRQPEVESEKGILQPKKNQGNAGGSRKKNQTKAAGSRIREGHPAAKEESGERSRKPEV